MGAWTSGSIIDDPHMSAAAPVLHASVSPDPYAVNTDGHSVLTITWDHPAGEYPFVELSNNNTDWYGAASQNAAIPYGFDGYVRIVLQDATNHNVSPYSNVVHITGSLPTPTGLIAVANSPTNVQLSWD